MWRHSAGISTGGRVCCWAPRCWCGRATAPGRRGQRARPEPRPPLLLAVRSVCHGLEENTPADGPEGHEERGHPDAPRVHATPAAVEQAFGIS